MQNPIIPTYHESRVGVKVFGFALASTWGLDKGKGICVYQVRLEISDVYVADLRPILISRSSTPLVTIS